MIVHWTDNALRHLTAIHDYIAQNSARYAQDMVDRITRRTQLLAHVPFSGGEVPEYEDDSIREVLESPYRIIYRVREERIDIVAVVHGARQLPHNPPR
jgi:toxin ParE1/3/4